MTQQDQFRIINEAQQAYRFYLYIDDIPQAFITNVSRPSYQVGTEQFKLLNHYFNQPTDIKWQPITFTIRELFSTDMFKSVGKTMMDKLTDKAYNNPQNTSINDLKNFTKRDLMEALGTVCIHSITPEGETYEKWTLNNAMITDVKFSQLDYASEALTDINVTVTYDWADLQYMRQ